jgi:hypothetical protein
MWGSIGDTSQDGIQLFFFVISVLCIPLMLIPKPLYLIYCQKKQDRMIEDEERDRTGRLLGSG